MHVLVTGSTGFVGRNLLLDLLADPSVTQVTAPVRNRQKLLNQLQEDGIQTDNERINIVETSAPHWEGVQTLHPDAAILCAGVIFARSMDDYRKVNTQGTLNLLEQLPTHCRSVVLSSLSAGGPCPKHLGERDEQTPDTPVTWYGVSKLEMENEIRAKHPGRSVIFLRPPMILGARDTATLPLFKMAKGFIQFKPGLEEKKYSYISVNDLNSAILRAIKTEDWTDFNLKHFYINASVHISDIELIENIILVTGSKKRLLKVPQPILKAASRVIDSIPAWRQAVPSLTVDRAKEIWPTKWTASPDAFQQTFQWQSQEPFRKTLESTYRWYQRTQQL